MRQSWDKYFINIAQLVAERSTCERLNVGCVIVKDRQILGTGYNGSISGDEHCIDVGCKVVNNHCIRTVHAEMNGLLQCAKHGVSTNGATIYCTHFPCLLCAKLIIQAGIKEVVYLLDYKNDQYAYELFDKSGVNIRQAE